MATLPCDDGAGSLNNPNGSPEQIGTNNPELKLYSPADVCIGEWQISSLNPDLCANADQLRQESYVAETLNISGAPINVYRLLGIHEQGNGSLLSSGKIISSLAYPGYPITGINSGQSWKSFQTGPNIVNNDVFVGIDFGVKLLPQNNTSQYSPAKPKWTSVGAVTITQANTPNEYARQVKVEITDGECSALPPAFSGLGNGILTINGLGSNVTQGQVTIVAITPTTFNVFATLPGGDVIGLNTAQVGVPFSSTFINFTITNGSVPFFGGDLFSIQTKYVWKRAGIFNLTQSPLPQTLNLQYQLLVKAIRVIPTLFTGSGNWEILALDVLDFVPTNINNIQDLFFNENRDRDYAKEPVLLKAQYSPADSISDLAKFGLSILDQYTFTMSFASMVAALGRPIVTGDIVEVIPEMQFDQNLKPVRKFLEVTDTGWAAEGYSTQWKPTVYRFSAQQALPSQETRDIFGTLDTQKYMLVDNILSGNIGQQLDTLPLTQMEEIAKDSLNRVPEIGSDDQRSTIGQPLPVAVPPVNLKGQPLPAMHNGKQNNYIEDGLPKNGEPYGEGFKLPDISGLSDGDYFRLYYPPETAIAPRLFRFSIVKNRWLFLEQDRRGDNSSHKPSIRSILQSESKQGLGKKTI